MPSKRRKSSGNMGAPRRIEIFSSMATNTDFEPTDACLDAVRTVLGEQVRNEGFGNARFVRNLFEAAVIHHAWRLRDVTDPDLDELRTLHDVDIVPPDADDASDANNAVNAESADNEEGPSS